MTKHRTKAAAALTDTEIAGIVFNETRSLSGPQIDQARTNIAHTIINAEAARKLPQMASTRASPPAVERQTYADCLTAVQKARGNIKLEIDPTSGAMHFNFRKNDKQGDFQGHAFRTSIGPLDNSYPTDDLPATGIYADTYE